MDVVDVNTLYALECYRASQSSFCKDSHPYCLPISSFQPHHCSMPSFANYCRKACQLCGEYNEDEGWAFHYWMKGRKGMVVGQKEEESKQWVKWKKNERKGRVKTYGEKIGKSEIVKTIIGVTLASYVRRVNQVLSFIFSEPASMRRRRRPSRIRSNRRPNFRYQG